MIDYCGTPGPCDEVGKDVVGRLKKLELSYPYPSEERTILFNIRRETSSAFTKLGKINEKKNRKALV